jgi:serine/threonine protein kinase/WD40 repeat protein
MNDSSGSHRDPVEKLAEEFLERRRQGETPTLAEYVERYPELADEIRQVYPALVLMEQADPGSDGAAERTRDFAGARTNPMVPQQIGGFRILREIGRGGMGVVYEAEQMALGRRVALKVLAAQPTDDGQGLERFRREAQAAARLHHTNIVPVYEVAHEGQVCYYAMQYIRGQPLDEVLHDLRQFRQAGPAPQPGTEAGVAEALLSGFAGAEAAQAPPAPNSVAPDQPPESGTPMLTPDLPGRTQRSSVHTNPAHYYRSVARVGIQVAQALEYAHREGVVHRDIKPSNLLLDGEGRVWVTDFGLAKMEGSDLTRTGDIVGTWRYMPPERFRGWSDPRSDVYSLGLTLYEMLLLRPAFADADHAQLIRRVIHEEPRRLRSVDPAIPRDLATIVHKAIAKEPAERYPSGEDLAADLQRFLEDRPIRARPSGTWEQGWRWCRRNPAVAVLLTLVVLVTLLGFVGILTQWQAAEANARTARENEDLARARSRKIQQINTELVVSQDELRNSLYFADMKLIHVAWETDQVGRLLRLLDQQVPRSGAKDLRRFEWHYRNRLARCAARVVPLAGGSWGSQPAFAPGAKMVAASAADKDGRMVFKLWDPASGNLLHTLKGSVVRRIPTGLVYRVDCRLRFSPDGKRRAGVITAESPNGWRLDPQLWVWDTATGRELWHRQDPSLLSFEPGLTFSPDGSRLVAFVGDLEQGHHLQMWDAATGKPLTKLPGGPHFHTVAFMPDGKRLILERELKIKPAGLPNTRLVIVDIDSGKELHTINGPSNVGFPGSIALSSDGKRLAVSWFVTHFSAGKMLPLEIYDTATAKLLVTCPKGGSRTEPPSPGAVALEFSPDGKLLMAISRNEVVQLWDAMTGMPLRKVPAHAGGVKAAAFDAHGAHLWTVGPEGSAKAWRIADLLQLRRPAPPGDRLYRPSLGGNGRRLAAQVVNWDHKVARNEIRVMDTVSGATLFSHVLGANDRHVSPVLSADGRRLVAAKEGRVFVWDVQAGREVASRRLGLFRETSVFATSVALNRDGRRAAVVRCSRNDEDSALWVWDVQTGRNLLVQWLKGQMFTSAVFSPKGDRLAALIGPKLPLADQATELRVWDLRTEAELWRVPLQQGSYVAFSPTGDRLAVCVNPQALFGAGEVLVLNAADGKELLRLAGHTETIWSADFTPDGRRVLSCAWSALAFDHSSEIKVWDTSLGQEVLNLIPLAGKGTAQFSDEGRQIVYLPNPLLADPYWIQVWDATPLPKQ